MLMTVMTMTVMTMTLIGRTELTAETEFKKRYNGEIVSQLTGLTGKELSLFMRWMKDTQDQLRMKKDIINLNPELVPRWILYWRMMYDRFGK